MEIGQRTVCMVCDEIYEYREDGSMYVCSGRCMDQYVHDNSKQRDDGIYKMMMYMYDIIDNDDIYSILRDDSMYMDSVYRYDVCIYNMYRYIRSIHDDVYKYDRCMISFNHMMKEYISNIMVDWNDVSKHSDIVNVYQYYITSIYMNVISYLSNKYNGSSSNQEEERLTVKCNDNVDKLIFKFTYNLDYNYSVVFSSIDKEIKNLNASIISFKDSIIKCKEIKSDIITIMIHANSILKYKIKMDKSEISSTYSIKNIIGTTEYDLNIDKVVLDDGRLIDVSQSIKNILGKNNHIDIIMILNTHTERKKYNSNRDKLILTGLDLDSIICDAKNIEYNAIICVTNESTVDDIVPYLERDINNTRIYEDISLINGKNIDRINGLKKSPRSLSALGFYINNLLLLTGIKWRESKLATGKYSLLSELPFSQKVKQDDRYKKTLDRKREELTIEMNKLIEIRDKYRYNNIVSVDEHKDSFIHIVNVSTHNISYIHDMMKCSIYNDKYKYILHSILCTGNKIYSNNDRYVCMNDDSILYDNNDDSKIVLYSDVRYHMISVMYTCLSIDMLD